MGGRVGNGVRQIEYDVGGYCLGGEGRLVGVKETGMGQ